jgi:hypothetical protein
MNAFAVVCGLRLEDFDRALPHDLTVESLVDLDGFDEAAGTPWTCSTASRTSSIETSSSLIQSFSSAM